MGLELEIVRVVSEHSLIDSESYQRRYETGHGLPLEPGYYVVIQAERPGGPRYDALADYIGPFRNRHDAMRELGAHEHGAELAQAA